MRFFCPNFNNLAKLNLYFTVTAPISGKNTLYKDHGVFLFFVVFFSILYHYSQQPVSDLPMPWGHFLLSQRHSLYLRIKCTRGQQQKEWWDFLQYSDFSIFLVLVSHYAVIRVLFTVLDSFVLPYLLKSYSHLEGEQNCLKHQKFIICALQASVSPLP